MVALEELIDVNVRCREELKSEITSERLSLGEARKQFQAREREMERAIDEKEDKLELVAQHIKELKAGGRKKRATSTGKKAKASKKTETAAEKINVNGQHVVEACVKVVTENPGMIREELELFVGQKLKEQGLGMRGYDKRFGEAMKKGPFTFTDEDQVWLSETSPGQKNEVTSMSPIGSGELPVERLTESRKVD